MARQFQAYRRGVRLDITIAPKASKAIDRLLASGLYGLSRAEVAQRFVYAGLREAEKFWREVHGRSLLGR